MTFIKHSIRRPEGNPGIGIKPRTMLSLLDVDDILSFPPRDDKGVKLVGNIVMKPGKYSEDIYLTPGTVEVTSAADGDTDQVGFTPQVKFNHPGNSTEVREFKTNSVNRRFIVIVRYCDGTPADIIGNLCNPCKFTPSYTGNNDSNVNEMTFVQTMKGDDIGIYEGTIPSEEYVGTVEAATLPYISDGQYLAAEGSVVVNAISGGTHGALVTIVGRDGSQCSVAATGEGSNLILKDGSTVSMGSATAQVTLRAFAKGSGDLVWIEVDRHS